VRDIEGLDCIWELKDEKSYNI